MSSVDTFVPILNNTYLTIDGFNITNDATTPATVIDISAGICRDSTNTFDINLGNYLSQNVNAPANVSTTLNAAAVGVNGLDVGTLAASKLYYVYAILNVATGDTATILSLTNTASGGPVMPFNYSYFRHIGYAITNSSTQFYKAYIYGSRDYRLFRFDTPVAVLSGGSATTATNVNLINLVPAVAFLPVTIISLFTPAAVGDYAQIFLGGGSGSQLTIEGIVASHQASTQNQVLSNLTTISSISSPALQYNVSSSSDLLSILLSGFDFNL